MVLPEENSGFFKSQNFCVFVYCSKIAVGLGKHMQQLVSFVPLLFFKLFVLVGKKADYSTRFDLKR